MTKSRDDKQAGSLKRLIQTTTSSAISKESARKAYEVHVAEREKLHNKHYQSYAKYIIPGIVIGYLVIVAVILILDGFSENHFQLPNSVMVTLLCTTTVNVLGLMYIVAHHLFPKSLQINNYS